MNWKNLKKTIEIKKNNKMIHFDKKNTDHYFIFSNANKIKTKINAKFYLSDFTKYLSTLPITMNSKMEEEEIKKLAKSKLRSYFEFFGKEQDRRRFYYLFEL